jgi:hypothetical protein
MDQTPFHDELTGARSLPRIAGLTIPWDQRWNVIGGNKTSSSLRDESTRVHVSGTSAEFEMD